MREFLTTAITFFIAGGLVVGFWTSKIWPYVKGVSAAETAKAKAAVAAETKTVEADVEKKL